MKLATTWAANGFFISLTFLVNDDRIMYRKVQIIVVIAFVVPQSDRTILRPVVEWPSGEGGRSVVLAICRY